MSKRFSLLWRCSFALCVIYALMVLPTALPVYAQTTITVDTFADAIDTSGDCSLREAIIAANTNTSVDGCAAGTGDDRILLAAGTYTLTISGQEEQAAMTGDLDITAVETLIIQGAGAVSTTIDGGAVDRIFEIIPSESRVTISDLTIQNGRVNTGQGGGAILNRGILTLTNTIIQNNQVEGSTSADIGGAICNGCETGIGSLTIVSSTIRSNSADRGGAIFSNDQLTITNSSIISNSARAGAGLLNFAAPEDRATLINTTFSGNSASNNSGGILNSGGLLAITNSTIANNSAPLGAGIYVGAGEVSLLNTIIAGNRNGANCSHSGTAIFNSNGFNLSSDSSCPTEAEGDLNDIDPLLGPLGDYGGPTPTHSLSFLSPAIDAARDSECPGSDQRGVPRPQGSRCDIGAFEYDGTPLQIHLPYLSDAQ